MEILTAYTYLSLIIIKVVFFFFSHLVAVISDDQAEESPTKYESNTDSKKAPKPILTQVSIGDGNRILVLCFALAKQHFYF